MGAKFLQLQQLNSRIQLFASLQKVEIPPTGWLNTVRRTLGISLEQLGRKLSMTRQGVLDIERREKDGSITIKALRDAAKSLDMQLVYGLVPKDGSLEELIERKARELAKRIVQRTSNTMKLEDQEISGERLKNAIEERVIELKNQMPKTLWD